MKKYITIFIICLFSLCGASQVNLLDPFSGKPYFLKQYDNIQGSAYLFDDWNNSNVTDKAGTTFLNVLVKFDLYANKFFYNHGDTAYEFVTNITEVNFFPNDGESSKTMIFKKGFSINSDITSAKYLQVLVEGKITALKYLYKAIEETTEYNVPGKIKSFVNRASYYFLKDGVIISQKPNSKLLESLTKDR